MQQDNPTPFRQLICKDTTLTVEIPANCNLNEINIPSNHDGLFLVRSANQCLKDASQRPIPKMLFDKFWCEGELCILFADTNVGKSILAVQIGNSISHSRPIPGFKMEASARTVLYFDFELSEKQFENRYSNNYSHHYQFSNDFFRAEINSDQMDTALSQAKDFEEYLLSSLEQKIISTGTRVIIIDNITYLKHETEKAKNALPLMKELKALNRKYQLSMLVLAHTPKRDLSKPITHNDLQGSKMLINFCDSAFAIGSSIKDQKLRYLKQIKARSTEICYDSDNVCLCLIDKPSNFLQFEFIAFGNEREHLKVLSSKDKAQLEQSIIELKQSQPALSNRAIAKQLGINHMKVNRLLKKQENQLL